MKEIVVLSGKGGTGKTSVTASLAVIFANEAIIADCDVDAANMHLLLKPDFNNAIPFYSGLLAIIDNNKCINCGLCKKTCHFDAIKFHNKHYVVNPLACEGCSYCEIICPTKAIILQERLCGNLYISTTRLFNTLVHAKLDIGAENSGKLVAKVKSEAKRIASEQDINFIIVDGSPGIGCPVASSLAGANYVLLVTEPTISGLHDLKRIYELIKKSKIKAGCIINKYDLNLDYTKQIINFLLSENITHLANIKYDTIFTNAITNAKTIVEIDLSYKTLFENILNRIKDELL